MTWGRLAGALTAIALIAGSAGAASAASAITVPGHPKAGAYIDGRLWVLVDRGAVRRAVEVDPAAGRATGRAVRIGAAGPGDGRYPWNVVAPPALVVVQGGLWTVDAGSRTAIRIDPVRARATARVRLRGTAIASGAGGLWALDGRRLQPGGGRSAGYAHRVLRLDPRSGRVLSVETVGPGLGSRPFDRLAVGRDRIWLSLVSATGRLGTEVARGGVAATRIDGWRLTAHAGALFTASFPCTIIVRPGQGPVSQRSLRTLSPRLCRDGTVSEAQPQDVVAGPARSVWELFLRGVEPPAGRSTGLVTWRRMDGTGRLRVAVVGRDPVALIPAPGAVWVVDRGSGRLMRVPASGGA